MKLLIVGSGGREHAIAWSLRKNPAVEKIYCAPGNGGIAQIAECVDIAAMDFDGLRDFALKNQIDLTFVGMDDPLVGGIVDVFEEAHLPVFGPRKNAAILEGSKAFAKEFMKRHHIPTASYEIFSDPIAAKEYLKQCGKFPVVLKADGLALGKGVLICNTLEEALAGVDQIMVERKFGDSGKQMVVEECLTGREVSVLAFCDGTHLQVMSSAQDHKRALDGDLGLNTGGMGTFSPSPFYTDELQRQCMDTIFLPTVAGMKEEGRPFTGVLYFGLMLTEDGPKVLEYNVRFGDPEAQVILPRMETDLLTVVQACMAGTLDQVPLVFSEEAAVCVVLASEGYPVHYEKGFPIEGLENFEGRRDVVVFHAGTKRQGEEIVTNGGRVLGVTALGKTLHDARINAYQAAELIQFENKYMRHDIGAAFEGQKV